MRLSDTNSVCVPTHHTETEFIGRGKIRVNHFSCVFHCSAQKVQIAPTGLCCLWFFLGNLRWPGLSQRQRQPPPQWCRSWLKATSVEIPNLGSSCTLLVLWWQMETIIGHVLHNCNDHQQAHISKVLGTDYAGQLNSLSKSSLHKNEVPTPTRRSSNLTNSALGLRPKVSLKYNPRPLYCLLIFPQQPKPHSFKSIAYEAGLWMERVWSIRPQW